MPVALSAKIKFLLLQFLNPWVISGFIAAFFAALCWMAAMTKLPLSQAYPWMSLAFVFVSALAPLMLGESFTLQTVLGTGLIILGLVVISQ